MGLFSKLPKPRNPFKRKPKTETQSNSDDRTGSTARNTSANEKSNVEQNYYKIIGVEKNATTEEIRKAYYKLARSNHYDKGHKGENMVAINRAKEALLDKDSRKQYDRLLKIGQSPSKAAKSLDTFKRQMDQEAQNKEELEFTTKARETQARETQARETQAREAQAREAQAREAQAREAQAREAQAKETQAIETQEENACETLNSTLNGLADGSLSQDTGTYQAAFYQLTYVAETLPLDMVSDKINTLDEITLNKLDNAASKIMKNDPNNHISNSLTEAIKEAIKCKVQGSARLAKAINDFIEFKGQDAASIASDESFSSDQAVYEAGQSNDIYGGKQPAKKYNTGPISKKPGHHEDTSEQPTTPKREHRQLSDLGQDEQPAIPTREANGNESAATNQVLGDYSSLARESNPKGYEQQDIPGQNPLRVASVATEKASNTTENKPIAGYFSRKVIGGESGKAAGKEM